MLATTDHRAPLRRTRPVPLTAEMRLRQIAVVASTPNLSSSAARLFAGMVAIVDDEGRAMIKPRELAALAGGAGGPDWALTLARELASHLFIEVDAAPRLATAVRVTLTGEYFETESTSMARRLREARR